jgi:hypothetical protein
VPELDIDAEDHRTTVQDGLHGQGFLAACFQGRRRHDLEALVAYPAYKRRSPEGSKTRELANEMIGSEPLEAWENEGGADLWLSA